MRAARRIVVVLLGGLIAAGASGGIRGASPNLAFVEHQIAKYRHIPHFVPPGPAFDAARSLRGKTIFEIPITSAVPFVQGVEKGMQAAARQVGAKLVVYPNQGEPLQWAQGISTAISRHAAAITLLAQDPSLLGPQIAQAKSAGIPVVVLRTTGERERCEADAHGRIYGSACVAGPFEQAGRLQADWAIADTRATANVLVITSFDARSTVPLMRALRDEFRRRCPSCRLQTVDVPIPKWAQSIRTEVQSALVRNPHLNYVIPIYDSMSQFVVPAIQAAGATGRVSIATFNGTPFVLGLIHKGEVVRMDVGEDLSWLGWAAMDQAFRLIARKAPARSEHTPLRIFDAGNVAEAGRPPRVDAGYGRAYVSGYRKLWRVQH